MARSALRRARRMAASLVLAQACAAAASATTRAQAPPDETAVCIASVEQAQLARYENKLRAAREGFARCARPVCPGPIRSDCARWLEDADAKLPTVRIAPTWNDGTRASGVRVIIDGDRVASDVDAQPLALDPGEHALRLEVGGARPVDTRVLVRVGEKDRVVAVTFTRERAAADVERPVPLGAWIAGAAGVVALAAFGAIGIDAAHALDAMRAEPCAQTHDCPEAPAARTRLLVSNVGEAAGVAALGVAVWLFLTRKEVVRPPSTTASLGASPRGVWAGFETRF